MSTQAVLQHHLESIGKMDLNELMKDYTQETVVHTQEGTLKGPAAIRELFEKFGADVLSTPNFNLELRAQSIEGEIAYIAWEAESDTLHIPLGTDTFVVKDGKIVSQTFAAHITPKA